MVAQGDDVLAPNSFKLGIAKQKGRFVGHGQQDAQELLTAFLELVNEENNRVKGKAKYR